MSLDVSPEEATELICDVLGPSDLQAPYNKPPRGAHRLWGHCAVASEALFYGTGGLGPASQLGPSAGGKHGWTVWRVRHEGATHWFLKNRDGIVYDPTAAQFATPVPYARATKTFFVTSQKGAGASKRALSVISRIKEKRMQNPTQGPLSFAEVWEHARWPGSRLYLAAFAKLAQAPGGFLDLGTAKLTRHERRRLADLATTGRFVRWTGDRRSSGSVEMRAAGWALWNSAVDDATEARNAEELREALAGEERKANPTMGHYNDANPPRDWDALNRQLRELRSPEERDAERDEWSEAHRRRVAGSGWAEYDAMIEEDRRCGRLGNPTPFRPTHPYSLVGEVDSGDVIREEGLDGYGLARAERLFRARPDGVAYQVRGGHGGPRRWGNVGGVWEEIGFDGIKPWSAPLEALGGREYLPPGERERLDLLSAREEARMGRAMRGRLDNPAVDDRAIHDLVRCLRFGGHQHDFGSRVYDAAEKRGLIRYDETLQRYVANDSNVRAFGDRLDNPALPRGKIAGDPPPAGTRVDAYRNLNVRDQIAWSVRDKSNNLVVAVVPSIVLRDVKLHVSESGRQRVIREKAKNVHAWASGSYVGPASRAPDVAWRALRYNPYTLATFVDRETGAPLHHVEYVMLSDKGAFYAQAGARRANPSSRLPANQLEDWNG